MHGSYSHQQMIFGCVSPEVRLPRNRSLRLIREIMNESLSELSSPFQETYLKIDQCSIVLERLLCFLLLQILYSIRSKRMLVELIGSGFPFRWCIPPSTKDPISNHSIHLQTRDCLFTSNTVIAFLIQIYKQTEEAGSFVQASNGRSSDSSFHWRKMLQETIGSYWNLIQAMPTKILLVGVAQAAQGHVLPKRKIQPLAAK